MTALAVGDVAYCLLFDVVGKRSRSSDRRQLRGAAAVRIDAIDGDVYLVVVVRASGGMPGERLELGRLSLYATKGEEESEFRELVGWYWPRRGADWNHAVPSSYPPRHPLATREDA